MAVSCSDALNRIQIWAQKIVTYCNRVTDHSGDAYTHWLAGQDHEAIYDLWQAVEDLNVGLSYCNGGWSPYSYEGYLHYYLVNCIEAPSFDMDDIINAMLLAEPDEIEYFIGIVDAFRMALWNKPFNSYLFEALARGFAEWV